MKQRDLKGGTMIVKGIFYRSNNVLDDGNYGDNENNEMNIMIQDGDQEAEEEEEPQRHRFERVPSKIRKTENQGVEIGQLTLNLAPFFAYFSKQISPQKSPLRKKALIILDKNPKPQQASILKALITARVHIYLAL